MACYMFVQLSCWLGVPAFSGTGKPSCSKLILHQKQYAMDSSYPISMSHLQSAMQDCTCAVEGTISSSDA